jgi:hypothetical protein
MALLGVGAALLLGALAGLLAANHVKPGRWCPHCGVSLVCPNGHPEVIHGSS